MFTSFTPTPICGCIQCRRIAWRLIAHQVGIDNFHAAERTLHATSSHSNTTTVASGNPLGAMNAWNSTMFTITGPSRTSASGT